jgi:hypothetical protein
MRRTRSGVASATCARAAAGAPHFPAEDDTMLRALTTIVLAYSFGSASLAQTTTLASVAFNGRQANDNCTGPSLSQGGRYVAFFSPATNLVPGDTNGVQDVFLHDEVTGATSRVSVDSTGAQANAPSQYGMCISADGRYVAFTSAASNLVPGDTNATFDIFVRDTVLGITTRASVDSNGSQANNASYYPSISADGRYVAFYSTASNLIANDSNGTVDVFVHDMVTGATTCASVDSNGVQGNAPSGSGLNSVSISSNGRFVAFLSSATNLVPGDTNGAADVFVRDLLLGTTTRASVDSSGGQANGSSLDVSISSDGRFVAFTSTASNLAPGDTNLTWDVFTHDMSTGVTTRVSVSSQGVQANDISRRPSISADGRFVAFESQASNLVPSDTSELRVFLHDSLTGTTTHLCLDSNGVPGNGVSESSSISADGRYVAFASGSTNLVPNDTNGFSDVFLRDRGSVSAFTPLCFGDGTRGTCPCSNAGGSGHGCENSASTGGAVLTSSGIASLSSDSVQLTSSNELPSALSIVLQGNSAITPTNFGDGLRCAGGSLKRLYVKHAAGGMVTAPEAGDPSISARSAALGDMIPLGATRVYQVYYRDPNLVFCPGGFNVSSAIAIAWGT